MHTHALAHWLSSHLCVNPHIHALHCGLLLNQNRQVCGWVLLKIDKSLTSVSGAQSANVGCPLDI